MKLFRSEFPTFNCLLRRLSFSSELAWPSPEEIESAVQDCSDLESVVLAQALTLYQRDYEMSSTVTFRLALYRLYAILGALPEFKDVFPTYQVLIRYVGMPMGSYWPSPDILQHRIEDNCSVNIYAFQRALSLYAKAYSLEEATPFAEIIYKVHDVLLQA